MGGQVPSSTGCCDSIRPAGYARLASRARHAICLKLNLTGTGVGTGTETGTGRCTVCFVSRMDDGIESVLAQSPTKSYIRTCAGLDGSRWDRLNRWERWEKWDGLDRLARQERAASLRWRLFGGTGTNCNPTILLSSVITISSVQQDEQHD